MVFLLPHTTHKLQPLDVAFFKPSHTYHNQAVERYLQINPRQTIHRISITETCSRDYGKSATVSVAANAFLKCDLLPVNLRVVEEYQFSPSSTIDVPFDHKNDDLTSASNSSHASIKSISTVAITKVDKRLIAGVTGQEETSHGINNHASVIKTLSGFCLWLLLLCDSMVNIKNVCFQFYCFNYLSELSKPLRRILYKLGFARWDETQNLLLLLAVLVFTLQPFKLTPTKERRAATVWRKIVKKWRRTLHQ